MGKRYTKTNLEKIMYIGFCKIDKIFDECCEQLDALKVSEKSSTELLTQAMLAELYSIPRSMGLAALYVDSQAYTSLAQASTSYRDRLEFDSGSDIGSSLGYFTSIPIYKAQSSVLSGY